MIHISLPCDGWMDHMFSDAMFSMVICATDMRPTAFVKKANIFPRISNKKTFHSHGAGYRSTYCLEKINCKRELIHITIFAGFTAHMTNDYCLTQHRLQINSQTFQQDSFTVTLFCRFKNSYAKHRLQINSQKF